MSNLLQLQNGFKSFAVKNIFDNAAFAVNEGEHVGVIGPNGAGKSTLFKILTGDESLDSGEVIRSKSLRLGYLAQHDNWTPDQSVEDYIGKNCVTPLWELKSLGKKLGLSDEIFARPIVSLSGGYRMRCKLLYLIGQEPNLMLLDEPTNYLDLETTLVLEHFLQGYKGAFLLISHDREFLRRTTDHVLEVEQGEITKYNGNLDDYFEQKTMLRQQLEARALSLQEKRDEVLEFVNRFGAKASKARQAQSRLKSLDRMETIELKALAVGASISIPPPSHAGKVILNMQGLELGYGEKVVLKNVDFVLNNGDHVAVIGLNGAGKSTFLKAVAQQMSPLKGKVELGYQVSIGYYAQHVAESLDHNSTVIDQIMLKAHSDISQQEGLNMAGSLLFSGDDVRKKISVLSGGEKSRVALGQILLQKTPCLVLDEPTNHLDFQTVEALTQALNKFEGTLVVVSHDRSFIQRVGKRILEINNGTARLYPGSYEDYVWSLEKGVLSNRDLSDSVSKSSPSAAAPKPSLYQETKEKRKALDREIRELDKQISQLDKKLEKLQLQSKLLNEKILVFQDAKLNVELRAAIEELGLIQNEVDEAELLWLDLSEKKTEAETHLKAIIAV